MKKIRSNVERDKKVNTELEEDGWRVIRFWEHDIRHRLESIRKTISEAISGEK